MGESLQSGLHGGLYVLLAGFLVDAGLFPTAWQD